MAIRPVDLDLCSDEVLALAEFQRLVDLKLQRYCASHHDPTVVPSQDQRVPLTFGVCPPVRVLKRFEEIYTQLGWDISTSTSLGTLLMMIGPFSTQTSLE